MASISQNISPTLDHLVNPAHPFYLHPGENPTLVLVSPLLTESNFHQWERDMVVALETKKKERFIHGTLPCPPITDPLCEAWRRSNRMVMSWLTRSMTPSIKQFVMWMDTASEIWRDLKDCFSHADKFRISDLQDQEMELYRCVLTCTYLTPCVCGLLSKLHKECEDDYVIRFLRGLNDNYAQHEREFIGILPKPFVPDSLAFAALSTEPRFHSSTRPASSTSKTTSRNNKFCEHCKKTNHTIETCYFRIGFPAGYKKSKPTMKTSASLVIVDSSASPRPLNLDVSSDLGLAQHAKDHSSSVNHASVHNSGTPSSFPHWIIDSGATFANSIMAGRTKLDKRASKCIFLSHFPYAPESQSISHHHNTGLTASQQIFDSLIAFDISGSDVTSLNIGNTVVEPVMQFNDDSNNVVQTIDSLPRVSTRQRKPPAYLSAYDCPTLSSTNISYSTPYPLNSYLSYSNCSNSHTAFCMSLSATQAMIAEIQALQRNDTWSLVKLPPNKKVVGCKWVYKTKLHAAGSVERHKARLVAKGFSQTEGMDFFETFSPVVKLTTVIFLISIALSRNWFLYQLDVDNAFLHGDLDEDSLYGLRQASRQWNSKLTSALLSYGFLQSSADHSLFTYHSFDSFIALLVYVDDIVLAGDNMQAINDVKQFLHHKFSIKDLGSLKFFLGFEVARSQQGLVLNQRKYCLEILTEFGLTGCKPATSPSNPTVKLKDDEGALVSDPTTYRRLIGKLQYLTNTRPDISFVVQQVSQFMSKPRQSHLHAAFRILKYLKGCPAFSDSDWVTCSLTRKSIMGYCVFYGHCLISWKSTKQSTVSRSSTEAEYRALASSAIQLAKNPSFHEQTKHIEVDCHLICAKILDGLIVISHVPSKHQLADMLTKSLYPGPFHDNLSKMGLLNIHHSS
ncbi:hypothetical protein V8G54_010977 [Vigna mungo]|uniref:Retrovirus-related Pol polyprotein from transposon RE1 n=1 Tax=Vigna mungo TaxID=3915 RepID=A0AAQ3S2I0_VIGMU